MLDTTMAFLGILGFCQFLNRKRCNLGQFFFLRVFSKVILQCKLYWIARNSGRKQKRPAVEQTSTKRKIFLTPDGAWCSSNHARPNIWYHKAVSHLIEFSFKTKTIQRKGNNTIGLKRVLFMKSRSATERRMWKLKCKYFFLLPKQDFSIRAIISEMQWSQSKLFMRHSALNRSIPSSVNNCSAFPCQYEAESF